jgi:hypothetical protein
MPARASTGGLSTKFSRANSTGCDESTPVSKQAVAIATTIPGHDRRCTRCRRAARRLSGPSTSRSVDGRADHHWRQPAQGHQSTNFPILWAFGSKEFEADGKTGALNSPETPNSTHLLATLSYQVGIASGPAGYSGRCQSR